MLSLSKGPFVSTYLELNKLTPTLKRYIPSRITYRVDHNYKSTLTKKQVKMFQLK